MPREPRAIVSVFACCHGDQLVVAFCCLGDLISLFLSVEDCLLLNVLFQQRDCGQTHLYCRCIWRLRHCIISGQFVFLLPHRFLLFFFWKTFENKKRNIKGNCVRGKLRSAGRLVQGRPRTMYLFCRTDNSLLLLAYNPPAAGQKKKVNNNWNAVGSPGCGRRESSARPLTNNREKKSMSRA